MNYRLIMFVSMNVISNVLGGLNHDPDMECHEFHYIVINNIFTHIGLNNMYTFSFNLPCQH